MVHHSDQQSSSKQENAQHEAFWLRHAERVQRKVNVAWWLQLFLPAFCGASLVFACLVVVERRTLEHSRYAWPAYGVALCVCALICLGLAKKYFFSTGDGFVQLEAVMRLHNRLSAACAGVGSWPSPVEVHHGLRWRLGTMVWPVLLSLVMLGMAAWVPMPHEQTTIEKPTHKPVAWEQMASALEIIEQSSLVQEQAVDLLKAQLEQLQDQPAEHWYEHSSLEAGAALRRHMENALEKLENDLRQMDAVLSELAQTQPDSGTQALQDLGEQFGKALDGLELGRLPLNEQLRDSLRHLDRQNLKGLSQDELAQLKAQLRDGAAIVKQAKRSGRQHPRGAARQGEQPVDGWDESSDQCLFGQGDSAGCGYSAEAGSNSPFANNSAQSTQGNTPGQGGITRGPGTAPLELEPRPGFGGLDRLEVVRSADAPDEDDQPTIGYSKEKPDVDRSRPHTMTPGGAAQAQGEGGAAVWKHTFTPEERDVLQRFFK